MTTTPRPLQPGHAARAELQAAVGEELAPGGRQLRRPLLRDDGTLAELTADGGDDRDRQLDRPADPPGRDRLEPRKRRQHGSDAVLALGETDGSRNLPENVVRRQPRDRRMQRMLARSTSRRSRIVAQHDVAVDVPAREQVDVGERELRPGVDAEVRLCEQEHAGDGAVRKGVELLADDRRTASRRGRVEHGPQLDPRRSGPTLRGPTRPWRAAASVFPCASGPPLGRLRVRARAIDLPGRGWRRGATHATES